ncbi:MAG: hypothetical protein IH588_06015 [Anaerolineales bacterium]|nr:hypothetical protein [Anaerolineales bacterium]
MPVFLIPLQAHPLPVDVNPGWVGARSVSIKKNRAWNNFHALFTHQGFT